MPKGNTALVRAALPSFGTTATSSADQYYWGLAMGQLLIDYRDQLALLSHAMASIDADNWMTDVLDFKTYMAPSEPGGSCGSTQPFKYYAAIV